MRVRTLVLMLSGVFCAATLVAQTAKDAEKSFRDDVRKHKFFLRGFSADSIVKYEYDGSKFMVTPPVDHTMAVVIPDSVSTKKDRIEIQGKRGTLTYDTKGAFVVSGGGPVKLEVMLNGADPTTVYPRLKDGLFFTSFDDALNAVPMKYKRFIPNHPHYEDPKTSVVKPWRYDNCPEGKAERPSVLHAVDPEFSQQARDAKVNSDVSVVLTVDKGGVPRDLWISKAAGYGLDERAATAVRQYVFKPATCDGVPLAVALEIEVSFKIY